MAQWSGGGGRTGDKTISFCSREEEELIHRHMCSSNSCASIKACHRTLSHHELGSLLMYISYMTTSKYRHSI